MNLCVCVYSLGMVYLYTTTPAVARFATGQFYPVAQWDTQHQVEYPENLDCLTSIWLINWVQLAYRASVHKNGKVIAGLSAPARYRWSTHPHVIRNHRR